jgi:Mitochondrial carrier protein
MVRKIYKAEGLYGFGRGFSAMFYGSVICGFIYFAGYKFLKTYLSEKFEGTYNPALIFFMASFIAEFVTLLVYYPYDLIKCRLQSKNYHFKYHNLVHAFKKEISQGSILSLYRGSLPFLVTHCLFVSI